RDRHPRGGAALLDGRAAFFDGRALHIGRPRVPCPFKRPGGSCIIGGTAGHLRFGREGAPGRFDVRPACDLAFEEGAGTQEGEARPMGLSERYDGLRALPAVLVGRAALAIVTAALATGCNPLLGVDDYTFGDSTTGSGGASGSGGQGAAGGGGA